MDPIPNINVQIRDISIPETQIWDIRVPNTIPKTVPVTTLIGTPIVNMLGVSLLTKRVVTIRMW